jgi:hypothetical protein
MRTAGNTSATQMITPARRPKNRTATDAHRTGYLFKATITTGTQARTLPGQYFAAQHTRLRKQHIKGMRTQQSRKVTQHADAVQRNLKPARARR